MEPVATSVLVAITSISAPRAMPPELDPEGIKPFGLMAEQVEKVDPDLVARDEQGEPYTVHYEAVNAMLLNEFLKEHREVQELTKQVVALTAGLQKVSAQLELNKSAPQTVLNNQCQAEAIVCLESQLLIIHPHLCGFGS